MTAATAGAAPADARPPSFTRLAAALVFVVTLLVFLPAVRNGFVYWDDEQTLTMNSRYRGLAPANLGWMFTTFHMGPYQPLSWMTLGLDYTLWGMNPAGYHLTNVLLHAANAALLCVLVLRLLRRARGGLASSGRLALAAAIGALVWAVHPLRVESVAWVTERRDVLSGLFVLLALATYVERPGASRPLVVAFTVLALLAKGTAMVLPGLLVVLDVYPLRRLGGAAGWTSGAARRVVLEKAPLVGLSAAAALAAVFGQRSVGALGFLEPTSAAVRLSACLYQIGLYVWKTILPIRLQPLYEAPPDLGPLHPLVLVGGGAVAALLVAAWRWRERSPALPAAVAAYLLAFVPTSGILQVGIQVAADRYTYLPALALAPLVAVVVARPAADRVGPRVVLGGLAILLLMPLTIRQIAVWRDSITLWEHGLGLAPASAVAHQQLGRAYMEADRGEDATRLYEHWLQADPGNGRGWSDYGGLLTNAGLFDRALPVLEKALALDSSNAGTFYARALIRDRRGDLSGALADYTESLRLDPALGSAYHNRGLIRLKLGDVQGALDDYARALSFEPVRNADNAFAIYANYGLILADAGQLDASLRALGTSLALAPPESRPHIEELLRQLEARRGAS